MRLRRPRFALVLSGLLALAGLAVVLLSAGGGTTQGPHTTPLQIGPGGPGRACQKTQAQAQATAHSAISVAATVTQPVRVSETAIGRRGAVTVTRTGSFTGQARATRPVSVTVHASAQVTACARAQSHTAAAGLALRRAYAAALLRARGRAVAAARRALTALKRRLYGSVAARAHSDAARQAQTAAVSARPAMIRTARRLAIKRAGG